MKHVIILFLLLLIANFLAGQKSMIKSTNNDRLVFNQIDTIDENSWIVNYEFRDQIDTIKYLASEKKGYIISHRKNGEFLEKEVFQSEGMQEPILMHYTSQFWIKEEELLKKYNGLKFIFPYEYLKKRYTYYKYGSIKEYQEYRYGETICEIAFINPDTFEETIEKHKCFDIIKTGIWKWYDVYGNIIKEEDNN